MSEANQTQENKKQQKTKKKKQNIRDFDFLFGNN
jgi:hypothetical protein